MIFFFRVISFIIPFHFLSTCYAQIEPLPNEFHTLLDSAKLEFEKEFEKQDYAKAVALLEHAIEIAPNHVEAKYFLGYAYSRLNAKDAKEMIDSDVNLTIKSSLQFEQINKISPKYEGELIVQDPYSKIASEWGALALGYCYKNKLDSAKWALKEGRKRGGFNDYMLNINKQVLSNCKRNTILITSGDFFIFSLLYLQMINGYRTDISVLDINLLNTVWYPQYLANYNITSFDTFIQDIDTIQYREWKDSTITIDDFSWVVKPSYNNHYLLRADIVLLSLLKENRFKKDISFTSGIDPNIILNLNNYLTNCLLVNKLTKTSDSHLQFRKFKKIARNTLKSSSLLNTNITDQVNLFNNFRYLIFKEINYYLELGKRKKAKKILQVLGTWANEELYPYNDNRAIKTLNYLRLLI